MGKTTWETEAQMGGNIKIDLKDMGVRNELNSSSSV
jgi:hypothetical protein